MESLFSAVARRPAAAPDNLSGGSFISLAIGIARGLGLVTFIPSVAALCESRRIRFVDSEELSSEALFSKAWLCLRLDPQDEAFDAELVLSLSLNELLLLLSPFNVSDVLLQVLFSSTSIRLVSFSSIVRSA